MDSRQVERMDERRDKIEFEYVFGEDYRLSYANGVYGGIGVRGEVVLNFFTENQAFPRKEINSISDEGRLVGPVTTDPEYLPIVRTVSSGVIMTKETAEQIYAWLGHVLGRD